MVCETCHGGCCKKFVVFVTAHDAARIAKNLNIDPLYFLHYYPVEISSNFPIFRIRGKDYLLGLDSKDGSMKECKFLMSIGIYRKCGIYQYRPMSCRRYPFVLNDNKLDFVEELVCPKQWWPEGKEKEQYINAISQFEKELEAYKKIVETWNIKSGEKGSFTEFLDFALKEAKV